MIDFRVLPLCFMLPERSINQSMFYFMSVHSKVIDITAPPPKKKINNNNNNNDNIYIYNKIK